MIAPVTLLYGASFGDEKKRRKTFSFSFSQEARDQVMDYKGWDLGEKLSDFWPEGKGLTVLFCRKTERSLWTIP